MSVKRNYNPEKTVSQKDTCAPMFIAALFTIAKTWKQPKCPSTEEGIKKMWYVYIKGILLSHKKGWNNTICSNMDGPRDYHTKWSKLERERQISYDMAYMCNLKKMIQMNLFTKQKQTHRHKRQTYGYQRGRGWR